MNVIEDVQQHWQTQVIEAFTQVVKAPYGELLSIGRLSHTINDPLTLQLMVEHLSQTPQGRQAFQERPHLGEVKLQQLHQLPKNTLGYLYADHLIRNEFTPIPAYHEDNDYSFLSAHISETHDIWHVVTGCDTTKAGEIELAAFYAAQLSASRFWLAMLSKNLLKTAVEDIELCELHLDALSRGWLKGKEAKPLFGLQWNTLWETPLENLRTQLNLAL